MPLMKLKTAKDTLEALVGDDVGTVEERLEYIKRIAELVTWASKAQADLHAFEKTTGIGHWVGGFVGAVTGRLYAAYQNGQCDNGSWLYQQTTETGFSMLGQWSGAQAGDRLERYIMGTSNEHSSHDYVAEAVAAFKEIHDQELGEGKSSREALNSGIKALSAHCEKLACAIKVKDQILATANGSSYASYVSMFAPVKYLRAAANMTAAAVGYVLQHKGKENLAGKIEAEHAATVARRAAKMC